MPKEKDYISTRLSVKVTPNAARNEVTGFTDGVLHVKIAAPPEKGKANKELIDYLSRTLGVSKSSLLLLKGQTRRNKVLSVDGLSRADIIQRISA